MYAKFENPRHFENVKSLHINVVIFFKLGFPFQNEDSKQSDNSTSSVSCSDDSSAYEDDLVTNKRRKRANIVVNRKKTSKIVMKKKSVNKTCKSTAKKTSSQKKHFDAKTLPPYQSSPKTPPTENESHSDDSDFSEIGESPLAKTKNALIKEGNSFEKDTDWRTEEVFDW